MSVNEEKLPRPEAELEALASHYDEYDTADEMEEGRWVDPMVTTSLRLPRDLFDEIKSVARKEGKRQSTYIREVLERSVRGEGTSAELKEIQQKLDVLLLAVAPDDRKGSGSDRPGGRADKRSA